MAQIAKKMKRYPSDLTDEEWDRLAPLMPKPGRRGRPHEVDFREVINAVRYLVLSGCGWRMMPIHFGAWQTVCEQAEKQPPLCPRMTLSYRLPFVRCGRAPTPSARSDLVGFELAVFR